MTAPFAITPGQRMRQNLSGKPRHIGVAFALALALAPVPSPADVVTHPMPIPLGGTRTFPLLAVLGIALLVVAFLVVRQRRQGKPIGVLIGLAAAIVLLGGVMLVMTDEPDGQSPPAQEWRQDLLLEEHSTDC